jgi:drug/metabolite transporter (DMT)-like permease
VTLGIGFALLAAFCFAVASVSQHRAAGQVEEAPALHPGLLLRLARQRVFLLSIGSDITGVVLQTIALGLAAVVVVQPTLTAGLLLAVPLSAWLDRRSPTRAEIVGAVLCTAGLATFLLSAHAKPGRESLAGWQFWPYAATCLLVTMCCVTLASRAPSRLSRSLMLAVGCGFLYGATGPLLRVVATGIDDPRRLFTTWPVYVLVVVGIAGYLLNQNAFQAGSLPAPLAVLTILDPIVGATAGLIFLHETVSTSPLRLSAMLLAAVSVVLGISLLSRSGERPASTLGGVPA